MIPTLHYRKTLAVNLVACMLVFSGFFASAQNAFWQLQYPKIPTERIRDIRFFNLHSGIAVGNAGMMVRTTDAGYNWSPLPYATFENLNCIYLVNNEKCWVGGDKGTLLQSADGGFHWSKVAIGDSINIQSVWFVSPDTGFIAGDSCILKTVNGGNSWSRSVFKANISYGRFTDIKFFGKDTGYAFVPGGLANASIVKTYDRGATWSVTSTTQSFYMASFCNKNVGWAVVNTNGNSQDKYYKTTNGGTSWTLQNTVTNYGHQVAADMQAIDSNRVYIVNNAPGLSVNANSVIYHTTNGGANWSYFAFGNYSWATAMHFITPDSGYIADMWGGIYATINRGSHFREFNSIINGVKVSRLIDIYFKNKDYGWAIGGYFALRTTNGGKTWTEHSNVNSYSEFQTMSFPDTLIGWATLENKTLYKTRNGGKTWSQVSGVSNARHAVFYDTSFGMASCNGNMAITRNGGSTWTNKLISATCILKKMEMVDSLHWFVHGTDSTTINKVYKTSDAGNTWSTASYTGEVNDMDFLDTLRGYLYDWELQKTKDGGITWQMPASTTPFGDCNLHFIDTTRGVATLTYPYNPPGLFMTKDGAATWTKMKVNTAMVHPGVFYGDTSRLWITTEDGSILFYDPSYIASPTIAPFLTNDTLVGCASSQVSVKIANYTGYLSSDTVRAYLYNGSTLLQTIIPDAGGTISFTTPATNGYYQLSVKVSNAKHPQGLITTIPVRVSSTSSLFISFWYSKGNPHCVSDPATIGLTNNPSIGRNGSYEVHRLDPNGFDTIVSVNTVVTHVSGVNHNYSLYYKAKVGTHVCNAPQYFYSDTLHVTVQPLQTPSSHIISSITSNSICAGDSFQISAVSQYLGSSGVYYEFHQVNKQNQDSIIAKGSNSSFRTGKRTDTTRYYCRIFPGWGGCSALDTFRSDTLTMRTRARQPIQAKITGAIPPVLCSGDTLMLNVSTMLSGKATYKFRRLRMLANSVIATDTVSRYTATGVQDADRYYCVIIPDNSLCTFKDTASDTLTIQAQVRQPIQASISASVPAICAGDTVMLNVTTALSTKNIYEFRRLRALTDSVILTDTLGYHTVKSAQNNDGYYCIVIPDKSICTLGDTTSDTINIAVYPIPQQPAIVSQGDTLIATPAVPGAKYQWYFNGVLLPADTIYYILPGATGWYTVEVVSNGCNSGLSAGYYCIPLHLGSITHEQGIRVYPNPASDKITIESSTIPYDLRVTDVQGRILMSRYMVTEKEVTLSTSSLVKGIYFIQVMTSKGNSQVRFAVQ